MRDSSTHRLSRPWVIVVAAAGLLLVGAPRSATAQERTLTPAGGGMFGESFGGALAVSGDTLLVGAPGSHATGGPFTPQRERAYVFVKQGGLFREQAALAPPSDTLTRNFGATVAIEGDLAVVGAPFDGIGAVYVFRRTGSTWQPETRLGPRDALPHAMWFGSGLALAGDRLFVWYAQLQGGPAYRGIVSVFRRTPGGWIDEGVLPDPNLAPRPGTSSSGLGSTLAAHGDMVLVGDPFAGPRGDVLVFRHDGTQWSLQTQLARLAPANDEFFWGAVAFDGRTALVGALHGLSGAPPSTGAAHVLEWTGTAWRYVARLTSAGPGPYVGFGSSLAVLGDVALVGAGSTGSPTVGLQPGRASVFASVDGTWRETGDNFTLAGAAIDDRFGWAVALTDEDVIVGAPGDDAGAAADAFDQGSVRVFDRAHAPVDADDDGLPSLWELQFGLDAFSAASLNGPAGDPDGDGRTNAQEWAAGTHPRGLVARYLAEGATGPFFDMTLAVLNAGDTPAHALWQFHRDDGTTITRPFTVPPRTRATLEADTVDGIQSAAFSTQVDADVPLIVDRTMTWDARRFGGHTETSLDALSTTWHFAEGATTGDFQLYYLLQNPQPTVVDATVTYLRPSPLAPLARTYTLPPHSRVNVFVNTVPGLGATDVSATIAATAPIAAERAMYLSRPGQAFAAGHASAGVPAPMQEWFLAEGATGAFFDLFVLIANPNDQPAQVMVTYLLPDGTTLSKTHVVAERSRFTIYVNDEPFPGPGGTRLLANTAVATTVTSTNGVPIIVERAMWWPHPAWHEAHSSVGATATGPRWAVAGGEDGGAAGAQTYVLVANTSAFEGQARVTVLFETSESATRIYTLPANSRTNVPVGLDFAPAVNRRFGVLVESLGTTPAQLVVERATYWNSEGVVWAAGVNALGTRVP